MFKLIWLIWKLTFSCEKIMHSPPWSPRRSHSLRCPRGFRMKDGREGVALVCLEAEWTVRGEGLMVDLDLNCYRKTEAKSVWKIQRMRERQREG